MSDTPQPLAPVRAALKRLSAWWTASGADFLLGAYMASTTVLLIVLLRRYVG